MKNIDPALSALLSARRGLVVRMLVWLVVADRATGAPVSIGFANDVQPLALTIDGEARIYQAAGGALSVDPVITETGLVVRMLRITLSGVAPEVALAMRGYDPRLAPVTIHRQVLDPETGAVVGGSQRVFKGVVDQVSLPTPQKNGRVEVSVTVVSAARELTRRLALKKSNESQQRRSGDLFRQYADVSGEVPVWWGAKRLDPPTTPPVAAPFVATHVHSDK
jgi:hypothetical protein